MARRKGTVHIKAAAVVSGFFAALLIYRMISPGDTAQAQGQQVVVASRLIPAGTVLSTQYIQSKPAENFTGGDFNNPRSIVGRVSLRTIQPGTPIEENSLLPASGQGALRSRIRQGYRAVAVPVGSGSDRLAQPGDRVDVIATMEKQGEMAAAKIILQNVEVLSSPEDTGVTDSGRIVSLAVTPAEAERLALAQKVGTIQLLLRMGDDSQPMMTTGVTLESLFFPTSSRSIHRAQNSGAPTSLGE